MEQISNAFIERKSTGKGKAAKMVRPSPPEIEEYRRLLLGLSPLPGRRLVRRVRRGDAPHVNERQRAGALPLSDE